MFAETAEGKLRLTRAFLRKDIPQALDPDEQGGEERQIPPIPPRPVLDMFEEVALTLSLRLGQMMTRLDQMMTMARAARVTAWILRTARVTASRHL